MSNVVATESFSITMERKCLCPLIVTHGVDQAQRLPNFFQCKVNTEGSPSNGIR